jgi:uncharacterized protein YecT (DUF1311 family)
MIRLNAGNVLLKPSQRRQLNAWLTSRLGDCSVHIDLHRSGHAIEMIAGVTTLHGKTAFRARESDWRSAAHRIVRMLTVYLHDLTLRSAMPAY